jgi:hypothetical protein
MQEEGKILVRRAELTKRGSAMHGLSRCARCCCCCCFSLACPASGQRLPYQSLINPVHFVSNVTIATNTFFAYIGLFHLSNYPPNSTLANNMVVGVSTGFEKRMEMVGTGYRAAATAAELTLSVGYSKPRVLAIPEGVSVKARARVLLLVPLSLRPLMHVHNSGAFIHADVEPLPLPQLHTHQQHEHTSAVCVCSCMCADLAADNWARCPPTNLLLPCPPP